MKKRYLIPIVMAVVAVIAVVVVMNPFANGNTNAPDGSHNSTTDDNPATNSTQPGDRPPITSNWINPGKIYVDNYEPGATVVLELEVHNGNAEAATFSVDYRYPDNVSEGYSLPTGVSDWVKSKEKFITIGARETYIAKIWLHMPSDGVVLKPVIDPQSGDVVIDAKTGEPLLEPADKWEFWIGVIDKSQTGNVITELAARVLVTMK